MAGDKIQEMFNIQKDFTGKFFKEKFSLDIDNMTEEERIYWSKEFILSGSKEMYEMLDEINWKKHRFTGQSNNIDNFIEEGVDTMKFLINLFVINGCSAEQFYEKFIDKSAVVDIRYKQETELQYVKQSTDKFVVFDIDGVLNNYPDNFLEYAKRHGSGEVTLAEYKTNELMNYKKMKKQFRMTGQERNAEVNPQAKQLLLDMKQLGYKIILLTARPYKKHSRLFSDTTTWFKKHGLIYDFIFFDEHKEELLINTFRKDQIQFVIDDDIDNVNKLKDYFDNVFLVRNDGVYTQDDYKYVKDGIKIISNINDIETYPNILRAPSSIA